MKALLLILPRLAGMAAALMADRAVPGRAKILLAALAVYLVTPLDLIPDFIPFFGWLDDAVLVALVLDRLVSVLGRRQDIQTKGKRHVGTNLKTAIVRVQIKASIHRRRLVHSYKDFRAGHGQ